MPSGPSTSSSASSISPAAENLSYAVLALGDSSYEHFCKFGIDLDNKLAALGGVRICDRVDCDLDLDEAFAQWKTALYTRLDEITAARRAAPTAPSSSVNPARPAATSISGDDDEDPPQSPTTAPTPISHLS